MIKRTDSNHRELVNQIRKLGASVWDTHELGKGFPDLIVGIRNQNFLLEVKDGKKSPSRKRLTEDEQKFFNIWKGQVAKVETLDEVIKVLGL